RGSVVSRGSACGGVGTGGLGTWYGADRRVQCDREATDALVSGSDDGRNSKTSLAWGAGVQFNPTESVAIDIAYEGSGSGDWRTDGFIVGVGYKF
ncbi:Ail/Lom family outer membrane beta-barrel protein, partial [Escherichia coli]|uniref:Ail/Lom family outer membrane beta-barrel protein n=1 Tax=Escherichia coli TaxID=562 RepID=UPI00207BA9D2